MQIITTTTPDEFRILVKECFREIISEQQSLGQASNKPMTLEDTAQYLNLPKQTLYQLTSKREIPFRKVGRRLTFLASELDTWLAANRKQTRSEIENQSSIQKTR